MMRVELPPDPSSARLARKLVRDHCERADFDADIPLLCVSELVSNALLHAEPPMELEILASDDRLRVALYDASPVAVDVRRPVLLDATSGRGLAIVDALASRWSADVTSGGKVVWFELDRP